MYCFTYANNFNCIFNELLLWSEISSEHPIFIKTVASLTKKNLSKETLDKLDGINKMFSDLNSKVKTVMKKPYLSYPIAYNEITKLINEFLLHDNHFLKLLPEVKAYGKEDKVWQELLAHITHEQKFMYELFNNLKMQFK